MKVGSIHTNGHCGIRRCIGHMRGRSYSLLLVFKSQMAGNVYPSRPMIVTCLGSCWFGSLSC
jgi:hypothetical protein